MKNEKSANPLYKRKEINKEKQSWWDKLIEEVDGLSEKEFLSYLEKDKSIFCVICEERFSALEKVTRHTCLSCSLDIESEEEEFWDKAFRLLRETSQEDLEKQYNKILAELEEDKE